jgi:sigma-B regulation protein RsbU (phosphoserine phosphatase)
VEVSVFQRIQKNLRQKRQTLSNWLNVTPTEKKAVQLGTADPHDVEAQIAVIDEAIEKAEDETLGLCEVCEGTVEHQLLEMDYTACVCLDHLSEPERRRLEAELEFSQIVQRAMMPQTAPNIPGLDVAAFTRPSQIIGGDFVDFFEFRDHAPGFIIADAMGHGVSAGMLMASLQTGLRTLAPEVEAPAAVIDRLNRVFLHNANFTTFVTAFLARYDPPDGGLNRATNGVSNGADGKPDGSPDGGPGRDPIGDPVRKLTYCNAGHNPPLLYRRAEQKSTWLNPTGPSIGLVENFQARVETVPLMTGDMLFMYTDGVTEATNPQQEEFGAERLKVLLDQNAALSAQNLLLVVRHALTDFIGSQPLEDDITLLVCKAI